MSCVKPADAVRARTWQSQQMPRRCSSVHARGCGWTRGSPPSASRCPPLGNASDNRSPRHLTARWRDAQCREDCGFRVPQVPWSRSRPVGERRTRLREGPISAIPNPVTAIPLAMTSATMSAGSGPPGYPAPDDCCPARDDCRVTQTRRSASSAAPVPMTAAPSQMTAIPTSVCRMTSNAVRSR